MAYTTVQDLFTGICDSIRAKTGKTDKINHQDIPTEIDKISPVYSVRKISGEDYLDVLPSRLLTNGYGEFYMHPLGNANVSFNEGSWLVVFIMVKIRTYGGTYYSFWLNGATSRGTQVTMDSGGEPFGGSVDGKLMFTADGRIKIRLTCPNGYEGGEFLDIVGMAVTLDENIAEGFSGN